MDFAMIALIIVVPRARCLVRIILLLCVQETARVLVQNREPALPREGFGNTSTN